MSDVLLIQNTRIEGSGYLGRLLQQDGFNITSINAKYSNIPDGQFSLIVVLGAPDSANDDLPHLRAEIELIKRCVHNETPLLGICLGSQLAAKALGSHVYKGSRKEIGFYDDLYIESDSQLFAGFDRHFTVFHWHADTFDLPNDATRLVSSTYYKNQAFQYKSIVGLQFHLEIDYAMVNLWLDNTQEKIREVSYIDPDQIRANIELLLPRVNKNMMKFYTNFKSEFGL